MHFLVALGFCEAEFISSAPESKCKFFSFPFLLPELFLVWWPSEDDLEAAKGWYIPEALLAEEAKGKLNLVFGVCGRNRLLRGRFTGIKDLELKRSEFSIEPELLFSRLESLSLEV